nr:hypothetical protein [Gammaproteobacteria bacterium]
MTNSSERYTYGINPSDVITWVSDEWLRFAQENDAPELSVAHVIGQSLWRFIVGADVQRIYQELFRSLRSKRAELIIPFRCDSPTVVRHMELTLRSPGNGVLEFEGRLLRHEMREPVSVFYRHAQRSNESISICSLCRRLLWQKEWIDVGAMIVRRRLFNTEPIPRLDETVCPDCRSKLA